LLLNFPFIVLILAYILNLFLWISNKFKFLLTYIKKHLKSRNYCFRIRRVMHKFNHYNQDVLWNDKKTDILMWEIFFTNNWEKVSPNDIFNFHWLSDDDIIKIVNEQLKIDIKTPSWIDKLNEIFFKSLKVYWDTIWRFKHYRLDIDKIESFNSFVDVLSFLKETNKESLHARKYCVIAKISRAVRKVLSAPLFNDLEWKHWYILSYLKEPLYLEQVWDDFLWHIFWWKEKINFLLTSRIKSFNSTVLKTLHDPKYDKAKDLKDGLWFTFKVDNWVHAIRLMQYVDSILESKNLSVSSKVTNLEDIIDWCWTNFRDDFLQKLKLSNTSRKLSTSDNYEDLKLIWELEWNISIEIKFVLKDCDNENGINFEPIYAMLKKDIEWNMIRQLKQYVDNHDLEWVVDDFLTNIEYHIESSPIKRWTSQKDYLLELFDDLKKDWYITWCSFCHISTLFWKRKIIKNWLIARLKDLLIEVKLESWDLVYTNMRAINLSEDWIYKKILRT
jgi:hypothetical protein